MRSQEKKHGGNICLELVSPRFVSWEEKDQTTRKGISKREKKGEGKNVFRLTRYRGGQEPSTAHRGSDPKCAKEGKKETVDKGSP